MQENYTVCNCKQVTYADIANALEKHKDFGSVLDAFDDIQKVIHCSRAVAAATKRCLTLSPR